MTDASRRKLPCPQCQSILPVSTVQAGELIRCACGASVQVPTLRELRLLDTLEPAAAKARGNRPAWTPAQGYLFVAGCLLLLVAGIAHARISPRRTALDIRQPEFQELQVDLQTVKPAEAWDIWQFFREQKLEFRPTPKFLKNREEHRGLSLQLYAAWAAGAVGLALAAGSLLIRR